MYTCIHSPSDPSGNHMALQDGSTRAQSPLLTFGPDPWRRLLGVQMGLSKNGRSCLGVLILRILIYSGRYGCTYILTCIYKCNTTSVRLSCQIRAESIYSKLTVSYARNSLSWTQNALAHVNKRSATSIAHSRLLSADLISNHRSWVCTIELISKLTPTQAQVARSHASWAESTEFRGSTVAYPTCGSNATFQGLNTTKNRFTPGSIFTL